MEPSDEEHNKELMKYLLDNETQHEVDSTKLNNTTNFGRYSYNLLVQHRAHVISS